MTTAEGILQLQQAFNINPIYSRTVFELADKDNLLEDAEKIIADRPKPFVKWVGGKRQLLTQFREMNLYPPEGFNPIKSTNFEPFVGGGAVFFDLLPKKAMLSDLNFELVIAYNIIKNDLENLIISLKKHKYEKEYFLKVRSQNLNELSDIKIASRFIYLNKTCFNGLYRVNKKGGFNVPFGKYNNPLICDEDNLRKISKALEKVKIIHKDYKHVLKNAKKGDFVYFNLLYYLVNKITSFTYYIFA